MPPETPLLVLPVVQDGVQPAQARLALSRAAGIPLLIRTVRTLRSAGLGDALVVVCHRELESEVNSVLRRYDCAELPLLPAVADAEAQLIADAVTSLPSPPPPVLAVLHPHFPGAPVDSIGAALRLLVPGVQAVVTVEAVTETLKSIHDDGVIGGTPPREQFARPVTPVAVRTAHLLDRAAELDRVVPAGADSLAMALAVAGSPVRLLHSPVPLQRADSEAQAAVHFSDSA